VSADLNGCAGDGGACPERGASIDELLDQAVAAINRGDQRAASVLAGQVLEIDWGNPEAEDLLAAPSDAGEIRRLTIQFADLVDSTELSTQVEGVPLCIEQLVGAAGRETGQRLGQRYLRAQCHARSRHIADSHDAQLVDAGPL
jgi:class 3 adenylate cyclase